MTVRSRTPATPPFNGENAVAISLPREQRVAVVFASPHSGRTYPASLLDASGLDPLTLRRSEDAFVDELFAGVADLGAPLIRAMFPRVYLDANREAWELDPAMFSDPLPGHVNTRSPRVLASIGTIARTVGNGQEIYREPLPYAEAARRIETCHVPYHAALESLVEATVRQFGTCLLVDCHSMPSGTGRGRADGTRAGDRPHIVLGDCWGSSCGQDIVKAAECAMQSMGYAVRRNTPYAGGYTTRHYGRPGAGIHALQIEIDRSLYMDEQSITRLPVFDQVQTRMTELAAALCRIERVRLATERLTADWLAAE